MRTENDFKQIIEEKFNMEVSNVKITKVIPFRNSVHTSVECDTLDGRMSFGIDKNGKVQTTGMT